MTRPPGRPRLLDPVAVWAAALAIADHDGVDGLTLRKLAERLGVTQNAIYTYAPDRGALLDAVADHGLAAVDLAPLLDTRRAPRRRLVEGGLAVRRTLLDHPAVATIAGQRTPTGPAGLRLGEAVLDALHASGLGARDAGRALSLLTVYVFGAAALEVAEVAERPIPDEAARVAARRATFAAVPRAELPLTAAAAPVLAEAITTAQFRWGLERILDGVLPRR